MNALRRMPVTVLLCLAVVAGATLCQVALFRSAIEFRENLLSVWAFSREAFWYDQRIWQSLTHLLVGENALRVSIHLFAISLAGAALEESLGALRFGALFLVASFGGLALFAALGPGSAYLSGLDGGAAGLLLILFLYRPRQRTMVFFAIPAPAWAAALTFLAAMAVVAGLGGGSLLAQAGGGIAAFLYARFALQLRGEARLSALIDPNPSSLDKIKERLGLAPGPSSAFDPRRSALEQARTLAQTAPDKPIASEAKESTDQTPKPEANSPRGDSRGTPAPDSPPGSGRLRYDPESGSFKLD